MTDLRNVSEPFNLEKHGFQLVNFPSGAGLDWQNEQQVSLHGDTRRQCMKQLM